MGLVNVTNEDTIGVAANALHFYVDRNLVYWDPSVTDATTGVVATANATAASNITTWKSQMITMNTRTQDMFNNDTKYPYLTEGTWVKDEMPNFKGARIYLLQSLQLLTYAINQADTGSTTVLADWRLVNVGLDYYTYYDWPIPVIFLMIMQI